MEINNSQEATNQQDGAGSSGEQQGSGNHVNDFTSPDDFSSQAMQDRAMQILSKWDEESNKQQPVENSNAQNSIQQQPANTVNDQQSPSGAGTVIEPNFDDASKTAFIGQDGNLDTSRINDIILNGKQIDLGEEIQVPEQIQIPDEGRTDPKAKYESDVKEIIDNFDTIVADLVSKGHDEPTAMNMIRNHITGLKSQYEMHSIMFDESKRIATELRAELESVREEKLDSQINRNYTELAQSFDNLIPGVNGGKVLDKFVLDKKYGGMLTELLFKKDNPKFNNLPENDKKAVQTRWFRELQANKGMMSMIANVGRSRWIMEQLPNIMQHAQQVGAAKSTNLRESAIGRPSVNNGSQQQSTNGFSSQLNAFFGIDSVN